MRQQNQQYQLFMVFYVNQGSILLRFRDMISGRTTDDWPMTTQTHFWPVGGRAITQPQSVDVPVHHPHSSVVWHKCRATETDIHCWNIEQYCRWRLTTYKKSVSGMARGYAYAKISYVTVRRRYTYLIEYAYDTFRTLNLNSPFDLSET